MTSATCGPTSLRQFAFYDPDSSCWRTFPAIGLWGSEPYSATWPPSGTWDLGRAFELPTSALVTDESECSSSLPTPTAWLGRRNAHSKGDPKRWWNPARSNELSDFIATLIPTPTAGDAKSAANATATRQEGSNHHAGTTLTDWSRLLPTPRAAEGMNDRMAAAAARVQTSGYRSTLEEAIAVLDGASTSPPSDDTNESSDDQLPFL